ncbi:CPBP family intramembrane glutamic endopeptidase [Pseudobutyrivibrio ruminis]|uniref:CPBP family intramembrane glutamic endopeptidase n=1 Tax=Pseudobutyrivibrio ruminis TaxID=46206 RepID=UPI00051C51D3|nr:type II CAAX endopeptidase family protein [Pseudobutyrivibrio ruminis]
MEKTFDKIELVKLVLVFILEIVIALAVGTLLNVIGNVAGISVPTYMHVLALDICLLIPVFAYTIKKGDSIVEAFGFKGIKVATFFQTILLVIVVSPMAMFANVLSQFFVPNTMVQGVDQFASESVGLTLVATVLCAPVVEEIVCRGFFTNRLNKIMSFTAAAIISALMFGAPHMNINQFCYATVLGLIFAYTNRASGSIFTSMIMHIVFNGYNMALLFMMNWAMEQVGMDFAEAAEAERANTSSMISTAVVLGVLAVGSFFLTRLILKSIAKREGTIEA